MKRAPVVFIVLEALKAAAVGVVLLAAAILFTCEYIP